MTSSHSTPTTPEKKLTSKPYQMDLDSQPSTPITPENQLTSKRFPMDLDSPGLAAIDCSPNTREKMLSQKRKASQLLEKGSPSTTVPFLKWRLAVVQTTLKVRSSERKALEEANDVFEKTGKSKTELMAAVMEDEKALLSEKVILLSQGKSLEGDLNDVNLSMTPLAAAYITALRNSLELASTTKQKVPGLKARRLNRKEFSQTVHEYLGTEEKRQSQTHRFCNVLGYWKYAHIKCAHIIPFSFYTKEMNHMFGSDEAPLESKRNGLSLHEKIEEAFDNCWVTIVPLDTVACTPTEWKIIVLSPAIMNNMFLSESSSPFDKATEWKWRDIDGRKLTFLNENRPARRFLYMRYTLAWLHAEDNKWEGFKEKVPPGEVWASPNKPDGYLRRSILLDLGKMTGDRLPQDLISAGTFEDPETSNAVSDAVAGIRMAEAFQSHLDGERDPKQGEDRQGEEGEEGEEEGEKGEGLEDDCE